MFHLLINIFIFILPKRTERGEYGKYELPEDCLYYLFILKKKKKNKKQKNEKKIRKRPKKLFFSGSDPENKNKNSLELSVIHFILLLISETILASSRRGHWVYCLL